MQLPRPNRPCPKSKQRQIISIIWEKEVAVSNQTLEHSLNAFQTRLRNEQAEHARDVFFAGFASPCVSIAWKRVFDIVASVMALVFLSPLIVLTACLIKLTSRGPVVFQQERVGINRRVRDRRQINHGFRYGERRTREKRTLFNFGKPFILYKFRTMRQYAENGHPQWAVKDDPRVTPLGRVLRKSRIDEIPQFINVIRGDMSIVGPRPERVFFMGMAESDIPGFHLRLRTKPGITGLAQIELGYTDDTEGLKKKLAYDLRYIKALSIWGDLKIVLKTFGVVLTGKGAH
jgi:lipopolysaccharide/colanic/teichoic acid biosynthesis glycosyltransferase